MKAIQDPGQGSLAGVTSGLTSWTSCVTKPGAAPLPPDVSTPEISMQRKSFKSAQQRS